MRIRLGRDGATLGIWRGAGQGRRPLRDALGIVDLPPIWLIGFAVVGWLLARLAPIGVFDGLFFDIAALSLAAVSLGFAIWGAAVMYFSGADLIPRRDPNVLVTSGPFQFSRNPIYVADVGLLIAFGLWIGSVWPILLAWPLRLVLEKRFIEGEETRLKALFGAEYETYSQKVRRWL